MGNADADRKGRQPVLRIPQLLVDIFNLRLNQVLLHFAGMPHKHHELIPADPADIVVGTEIPFQHADQFPQHLVPGLVSAGIVDRFEMIHVKQNHVGRFQIHTGKKEFIPGPVIRAGQFIVGRLEIQMLLGQIPELIGAHFRDRTVLLDPVHSPQDRIDAKMGRKPDHKKDHQNLKQDDPPPKIHIQLKSIHRVRFRIVGQLFHSVDTLLDPCANLVFLFIILRIQHHLRSEPHFILGRKGRILGAQRNLFQHIRILFDPLGLNHQAHGIILPVHQLH